MASPILSKGLPVAFPSTPQNRQPVKQVGLREPRENWEGPKVTQRASGGEGVGNQTPFFRSEEAVLNHYTTLPWIYFRYLLLYNTPDLTAQPLVVDGQKKPLQGQQDTMDQADLSLLLLTQN